MESVLSNIGMASVYVLATIMLLYILVLMAKMVKEGAIVAFLLLLLLLLFLIGFLFVDADDCSKQSDHRLVKAAANLVNFGGITNKRLFQPEWECKQKRRRAELEKLIKLDKALEIEKKILNDINYEDKKNKE